MDVRVCVCVCEYCGTTCSSARVPETMTYITQTVWLSVSLCARARTHSHVRRMQQTHGCKRAERLQWSASHINSSSGIIALLMYPPEGPESHASMCVSARRPTHMQFGLVHCSLRRGALTYGQKSHKSSPAATRQCSRRCCCRAASPAYVLIGVWSCCSSSTSLPILLHAELSMKSI